MQGIDACGVPCFQPHRLPYPLCHIARTPVPSVLVRSFANVICRLHAFRLISKCRVKLARQLKGALERGRQQPPDRRCEGYSQLVRSAVHKAFHRHAPVAEHIVRLQNLLPVQSHSCIRVQAIEDQIEMLVGQHRGIHVERRLVLPIGKTDPLQLSLMGAGKGIRDQAVAQQVGLHCGWNGRRVPLLRLPVCGRVRSGSCQPKLPPTDDHPARHRCAFCSAWRRGKNSEEKSENCERYRPKPHVSSRRLIADQNPAGQSCKLIIQA